MWGEGVCVLLEGVPVRPLAQELRVVRDQPVKRVVDDEDDLHVRSHAVHSLGGPLRDKVAWGLLDSDLVACPLFKNLL